MINLWFSLIGQILTLWAESGPRSRVWRLHMMYLHTTSPPGVRGEKTKLRPSGSSRSKLWQSGAADRQLSALRAFSSVAVLFNRRQNKKSQSPLCFPVTACAGRHEGVMRQACACTSLGALTRAVSSASGQTAGFFLFLVSFARFFASSSWDCVVLRAN